MKKMMTNTRQNLLHSLFGKRVGELVLLLSFLLVLTWPLNAKAEIPVLCDSSYYSKYPYIRFVEIGDSIVVTDEEFLDEAAKVIFKVNKYDLPTNDTLLLRWRDELIPRLNSDQMQLYRVLLRGAASPEGPYNNNRRLGVNRAKALYDFFNKYMETPVSEEQLVQQIEIEDYRLLCVLMKRAADPDYRLVQALYDDYHRKQAYGKLKERLKSVHGGRLWKRLLRDYFPQLRAARILLYFRKAPVIEPAAVEVPTFTKPGMPAPVSLSPEVLPAQSWRIPRREMLSVKTNLLFYGVYMPGYDRWCPIPNVAVEYYPKNGHFTFGASLDCPWWIDYGRSKFFEIRNYQLETRYYLKTNKANKANGANGANGAYKAPAFRGLYLQAYAHGFLYEIGFNKNKGWRGHGYGAGVGAGFVMPVSRNGHWRLDLGMQVGWFSTQYDPFQYENLVNLDYHDGLYYYRWTGRARDFKKLQYRFSWMGPTRVGVTLSYDLLYRRVQKKGVSFRASEAYEPVRVNEANGANKPNEANEPERRDAQ